MRLPLYLKIVAWFLLNLVLLAGFFALLVHSQIGLGVDSIVGGVAVERVNQVALRLAEELSFSPASTWNAVVSRYEQAYRMKFSFILGDGGWIAGSRLSLPPEVEKELRPHHAPPPRLDSDDPLSPPFSPPPRVGPTGRLRFMVHTSRPTQYWVGVGVPIEESGRSRPLPTIFLAVSDVLDGHGLFYDFRPWVGATVGGLILSILLWLPFVASMTRALSEITHAAERIAEGEFAITLQSRRGDEIGRLVQAVGQMARKLASYVQGQKRFLGDIAHELGSPLARMNLALGVLEQRAGESLEPYVRDVQEDVRHMSQLVAELLSFSKAAVQGTSRECRPVDLRDLIEQVLMREDRDTAMVEAAVSENLIVWADPELLSRALGNLIRNALRYAGAHGPITVRALAQADEAVILVEDEGPGVSPETLAHLGEPFYRPDESRTLSTGGTGLGLAIVRACVQACQGRFIVSNREPRGFRAEIRLSIPWQTEHSEKVDPEAASS